MCALSAPTEITRAGRHPRALILVRNTASHDSRVVREVQTLRRAGFDVLVAGVVSSSERERRATVAGAPLVRIDPLGRPRLVARGVSAGEPANTRASGSSGDTAPARRPRLRRLAVTASYHLRAVALAVRRAPELVHANDYNTMWIALVVKLLRGSRVVYDSHELWPDRNGRPEWRPWLLACEAMFVRFADVTITTSPGYADAIARRYRVRRPTVVRNIADRPDRAPPGSDTSGVAIYVGGLMPGRGLEQGIEALAQVPELRMTLVGPGNEPYIDGLRSLAAHVGVADRLVILPPVAPGDVVATVAGAGFGLLLIQPACRSYELTLPNKLFEYAVGGVPMLASDLPVIGRVVREHGLGEVVGASNVEQIAAAMRRLLDPEINRRTRERVRAFAQRETWEREREVLAGVYRSIEAS
jgi:glycosyltransferase involved in cell wall biosynthesis